MDTIRIHNIDEWEKSLNDDDNIKYFEKVLSDLTLNSNKGRLYYPGYCEICNKDVNFLIDGQCRANDSCMVNFRERLECPSCHLNNRMRAFVSFALRYIDSRKDKVYINEQVTPAYKVLKDKLQDNLIGSEYLGSDYESGQINSHGIRNEDALNLSFHDNVLDVVLSQDVLEHVPDIYIALREVNRVLREGGRFIFSVPFNPDAELTTKRAELKDGEIKYLLEPVYHGNPLGGGSLVYYDYGWDLLDMCRRAGFADVYIIKVYQPSFGNISLNNVYFFLAEK